MWRNWKRHAGKAPSPDADLISSVGSLAERLLEGRAGDGLADDAAVPTWIVVNVLAHSSLERLESIVAKPVPSAVGGWAWATAFLTSMVLAGADCPEVLEALQRTALVPLELDLFDDSLEVPNSYEALVSVVTAALAESPTDG